MDLYLSHRKSGASKMKIKSVRAFFVLPICLLVMNALQSLAIYKMERSIMNKYVFTGVLLLMYAAVFTIIGNLVSPWLEAIFEKLHFGSKRKGGGFGLLTFYTLTVSGLYVLYYFIYVKGPGSLLP